MAESFLANKTLVMIVGPSAIGKSTLMNEVTRMDSRFARVRSFTTRAPRANDEPGHYIYMTNDELTAHHANGTIITDIISPTTGVHYGTVQESYSGEYNLLDTLANSVDEYSALPFKRTITISLTTDPVDWEHWLNVRFPNGGNEMRQRLEEAVLSTKWSLAQAENHHWVVNTPNDITAAARQLIALAMSDTTITKQPPQAKLLYDKAKLLLSYQQKEVMRDD